MAVRARIGWQGMLLHHTRRRVQPSLLTHLGAARIGVAARQHPTCHLDIPYWSTTPYLFGDGQAVKYMARPRAEAAAAGRPV